MQEYVGRSVAAEGSVTAYCDYTVYINGGGSSYRFATPLCLNSGRGQIYIGALVDDICYGIRIAL